MKERLRSYRVGLMLAALLIMAVPVRGKVRNAWGGWMEYDYTRLFNLPSSFQSNGQNCKLGGMYERENDSFAFSIGLGLSYRQDQLDLDQHWLFSRPSFDTQGTAYSLEYDVVRDDVLHSLQVEIPLLVGQNVGVFYYRIGVGAGARVWGETQMGTRITTTGVYEQYVGPLGGMDNHGFRTDVHLYDQRRNVPWRLQGSLRGEIGCRLTTWGNQHLRLAATVAYNIMVSRMRGADQALTPNNSYNFGQYDKCPLLQTKEIDGRLLQPLEVGLKLTYLVQQNPQCKDCRCIGVYPWY